jgi:hypothetical protein
MTQRFRGIKHEERIKEAQRIKCSAIPKTNKSVKLI